VRLGFGKGKWGWGRDLALSQFSENRGGGVAKPPGGGALASGGGRARAARRVSRETRRGGETGAPFKNFDCRRSGTCC
jgi:hypothetical protein